MDVRILPHILQSHSLKKKPIMSKTILANGLSYFHLSLSEFLKQNLKTSISVVHLWKLVSQCSGHELFKCRSRYLVQKAGFFIFLFFFLFWWDRVACFLALKYVFVSCVYIVKGYMCPWCDVIV